MNNSLFPRNLPKKRKSYDINGRDGIFETEFLFYSEVFPRFVIKNFGNSDEKKDRKEKKYRRHWAAKQCRCNDPPPPQQS